MQSSSAEKDTEALMGTKLNVSQQCDFAAKIVHKFLGCTRNTTASMPRQVIHLLSFDKPALGFPVQERHEYTEEHPVKGHKGAGLEYLCNKRLNVLELHSLEKAQGHLIHVYKHLRGWCKADGARLYSVLPRDRSRGNGHDLKHKRFPPNIRKQKDVTEVCHR